MEDLQGLVLRVGKEEAQTLEPIFVLGVEVGAERVVWLLILPLEEEEEEWLSQVQRELVPLR